MPSNDSSRRLDVLIVGAGFAGLYALHKLRTLGFSASVLEAGSGIGGTWYWNRYPGARCDTESVQYSYSFSRELEQEWNWSERYATQPEILRYAEHVADRFDLRRDIKLNTRVTRAVFDESTREWRVDTEHGERLHARFCVMATGCLSAFNTPKITGLESFGGRVLHTARWPREGVDFGGQSVSVIGTGSSAIQAIPIIASEAKHVTVFQRTPNYAVPAHNRPLDPGYVEAVKADYPRMRARMRHTPAGIEFPLGTQPALAVSERERQLEYETRWARGGIPFLGAYTDLLFDRAANETAAEFVRERIRSIVKDPAVAERLSPRNVFGCKRLCVDTGYYATFNRPNVTLVDVSEASIEAIERTGVRAHGILHEADALVLATGFDAITGALRRIDIRGRDGIVLADVWAAGPRTYLGLMSAGFPNLFMITGPGSPSVLTNMIVSIEQHVEWVADCLVALRARSLTTIEPTLSAQDDWVAEVNRVAQPNLRSTCSSWYLGANIPGKPRVFMPYIGGLHTYIARCEAVVAAGYAGFATD